MEPLSQSGRACLVNKATKPFPTLCEQMCSGRGSSPTDHQRTRLPIGGADTNPYNGGGHGTVESTAECGGHSSVNTRHILGRQAL